MRLFAYLKTYANLTKHELQCLHEEKRIKVNDNYVSLRWTINDDDIVTIDNKIIEKLDYKYYIYNKPIGIESTISNKASSYINHININQKVVPAGRLDKNSHGLMILSNDGKFIYDLLNNENKEKEYIVKLKYPISKCLQNNKDDHLFNSNISSNYISNYIFNIERAYTIRKRKTKPMKVNIIDDYTLRIILVDGKYRQIRTIIKENGNTVIDLQRVRIDKYYLNDLKPGEVKEVKINKSKA